MYHNIIYDTLTEVSIEKNHYNDKYHYYDGFCDD